MLIAVNKNSNGFFDLELEQDSHLPRATKTDETQLQLSGART